MQAARLVKIEAHDGVVIATDEAGRKFSTPAGRFDWRPLDDPAKPPAPAPSSPTVHDPVPGEP
jgi:hypothetical protein